MSGAEHISLLQRLGHAHLASSDLMPQSQANASARGECKVQ